MQRVYELNGGGTITTKGKPKDFLINLLVDKIKRSGGRLPSYQDVKDDPKMVHPNAFAEYFKTYSNALESARIEYNKRQRGGDPKVSINPKYRNSPQKRVNPTFFREQQYYSQQ